MQSTHPQGNNFRVRGLRKQMIFFALVMIVTSIFSIQALAYNGTGKADAKIYYKPGVQTTVANLEARIWFSVPSSVSLFSYQQKFDATSSSWAFNATKPIRKHTNTMELSVTGVDASLSVSTSPGVSLSTTKSTATFTTAESNSYYRGINTYNNISDVSFLGGAVTKLRTTKAYSKMSLLIDGQPFHNQGSCWAIS
ncbi:MAG: hypothetical protein GX346_01665 [Clostridiales bacterium]|nr:hypothetical protein [Clostridiales bacterium]